MSINITIKGIYKNGKKCTLFGYHNPINFDYLKDNYIIQGIDRTSLNTNDLDKFVRYELYINVSTSCSITGYFDSLDKKQGIDSIIWTCNNKINFLNTIRGK